MGGDNFENQSKLPVPSIDSTPRLPRIYTSNSIDIEELEVESGDYRNFEVNFLDSPISTVSEKGSTVETKNDTVDTETKIYVQHRMSEFGYIIYKTLVHDNGSIYICGDAQNMAKAVHH